MKSYHHFIGIDIGKNEFAVGFAPSKCLPVVYPNTFQGREQFIQDQRLLLQEALVILEPTGGHEKALLALLLAHNIHVHRVDARKVKHFIRSLGQKAKTDALDAQALALYGQERWQTLALYQAMPPFQEALRLWAERRFDLLQMLVQEKNRLKSPESGLLAKGIEKVIACLKEEVAEIEKQMASLIEMNPVLQQTQKILLTVEGIGEKTAQSLLALLPELGQMEGKKMASLCGVAPHVRQSGQRVWRGTTFGGRRNLRPILFMAALGASRRKNGRLAAFYQKLILNGKKPIVALVALMRKIVVIANAKVRDPSSADLLKS